MTARRVAFTGTVPGLARQTDDPFRYVKSKADTFRMGQALSLFWIGIGIAELLTFFACFYRVCFLRGTMNERFRHDEVRKRRFRGPVGQWSFPLCIGLGVVKVPTACFASTGTTYVV